MTTTTPGQGDAAMPDDATLLLVPEGANYLRLPATAVYRMIKRGELPAVILGPRRIRLRRDDLDRWLDAHTTGGAA